MSSPLCVSGLGQSGKADQLKRVARAVIATVVRHLPAEFPRKRWLLAACEARLTGHHPIVTGQMRLGYRMRIDLRSYTEVFAYYTGRYETELVAAALRLMPVGGVAVDVGANVGFWTIPFAQRGIVHAFEPVPSNAARLAENAALNGVTSRLRIYDVALSDHVGSAAITLREDFSRGATTGNAALAIDHDDDRFPSLTVEVDTLDSLASGLGIERIDVMKVDIEGHEDSFLRGAHNTIARTRPTIFIEWNRSYYDRRHVDPNTLVAHALADLEYVFLRRVDGEHWDLVPAFESPKSLDDLIIAPREAAGRIVNALSAAGGQRGRGALAGSMRCWVNFSDDQGTAYLPRGRPARSACPEALRRRARPALERG